MTPRTLLLFVALMTSVCGADLRLGSPFGDHMVLQRGQPVPVWGWAEPGATIAVEFAGQQKSTTADESGAWRLSLAPLGTSAKPRDFIVTAKSQHAKTENLSLTDVLVGEVWLCGGQSNMERQLGPRPGQKPLVGWEAEVASANRPLLRQLYVPQTRANMPRQEVEASWSVCTPDSVINFTAVGYYFGRDLAERFPGVPIGLLHASWGGTPAEAWTSRSGLGAYADFMATIELLEAGGDDDAHLADQYRAQLDEWFVLHDPGATDATAPWFDPAMDDSAWATMSLPALWEDAGHDGFDGIGWFRREFALPAGWINQDVTLHLSAVDDVDTTWVNGHLLGTTPGWNTPRTYTIPAEFLRPSGNVIAVRVLDTGGGGGIWLPDAPLELRRVDDTTQTIDLQGDWSYQLVADLHDTPRPPNDPSNNAGTPTVLYNGMIAPLVPYALRGAIFYQGEANAYRADQYRTLLPDLISDWRTHWNNPEMPFLFVQIAPFNDMPPEIREAQLLAWQATENTAMAVTIDAGDAEDIHPALKEPVGERLALAARALAYGDELEYSGPVYRSVEFGEGKAVLHFDHLAEGLVAPGGDLLGFEIAGDDGQFHPADARIVGDTVVVSAAAEETPTAVRYAWADVASGNLYNTAGLPASPFRTNHP